MHVHENDDEMFEITEGRLEVTLEESVHVLVKGDVIFLPKTVPHGFRALGKTSMWVSLIPGGGENMFSELAALPPGPPDMPTISQISQKYGVRFL